MPTPHVPAFCSLRGCGLEASRWFEPGLLFGRDDPRDTFYLCDDHAELAAHDDEAVYWIDPDSGFLRCVELAVYACDDRCSDCNPD